MMPRETYDKKLLQIKDEILLLGSMVEQASLDSVTAFKNRDIAAAKIVVEDDQNINDKRFAIENAILILMATQQPLAHDLRMLASMLIVTNELERMGDYAKGIAHNTIRLDTKEIPIPIIEIEAMAKKGVGMLHRALFAFIKEDIKVALTIPAEDNDVDDLFNKCYRSIVNNMITNPATIDDSSLLLWVVHDLERFGDRVVNICERTVFIKSGEMLEMDSGGELEEGY
jgi:phosphate transport system protein